MSSLSPDDFRLLADPGTAALVERHLADDPAQLAFRLKCSREQARLVCQQVKYLQRAKNKLPSYYSARCIILPLSYEQCSSEAAASIKTYAGKVCIDLTGGMGVDSFHFSNMFDQVITVERDAVLAEVTRHNFNLLGAKNITLEQTSAESFLADYTGPRADLIYIDPARRREGGRVFLLEDCSPNVVEILPLALEKAERVLIKLSPLFDVEEALRVFAGHVSSIGIVSVSGEVKELLVELCAGPEKTGITIHPSTGQSFSFIPNDISLPVGQTSFDPEDYSFLLIPDAAFYKGRLAQALLGKYYPEQPARMFSPNGFILAETPLQEFPGRTYRILSAEDYQPKHLKKSLKEEGIRQINILRRDFSCQSEEIKRALGVQEGGTIWIAFTKIEGKPMVFRVEPVK